MCPGTGRPPLPGHALNTNRPARKHAPFVHNFGISLSTKFFNPSFLLCERGGEARAQEDKCGEISFVIHYVLVLVLQKTSCVQGWEDISSYRVFTLTFAKL